MLNDQNHKTPIEVSVSPMLSLAKSMAPWLAEVAQKNDDQKSRIQNMECGLGWRTSSHRPKVT